jgi:hypothetical protein
MILGLMIETRLKRSSGREHGGKRGTRNRKSILNIYTHHG